MASASSPVGALAGSARIAPVGPCTLCHASPATVARLSTTRRFEATPGPHASSRPRIVSSSVMGTTTNGPGPRCFRTAARSASVRFGNIEIIRDGNAGSMIEVRRRTAVANDA